ncbi:MAG: hypothetical protein ACYYK0_02060 [Candidatus Eutrophobiaceae bacterium]
MSRAENSPENVESSQVNGPSSNSTCGFKASSLPNVGFCPRRQIDPLRYRASSGSSPSNAMIGDNARPARAAHATEPQTQFQQRTLPRSNRILGTSPIAREQRNIVFVHRLATEMDHAQDRHKKKMPANAAGHFAHAVAAYHKRDAPSRKGLSSILSNEVLE